MHGNRPKKCEVIDILHKQKVCRFSGQTQFRFQQQEKFSIITEFQLICDKSYLNQVANSMFFIGAFFGTIVIGWISESFGRKPVMFFCLAIVSFIASLSAFADSFWYFILARSLSGFFLSGIAVSLYVIASEVIGFSYRTISDIFIWNYFSLGLMLLTMKAYLLKNWRHLQLVTTLPYLSMIACFRFFPESLRWLWRTGHYNRANKTVSFIAAENKNSDALTMFPNVLSIESDDQDISCFHVLTSRRHMLYFSILGFTTFVTGFIYYGLFLVSDYLSGNVYKDFALMAFIEIPANFLAIFCIRRIGRKKTVGIGLISTFVLFGILCILINCRSNISNWRSVTLATALFCKLSLTTSLLTLILWTKELHHLMGRAQSIDVIHSFRPLGGALAPWLTEFIIQSHPVAPFAIMCALSGIVGFSSFVLPDTQDIRSNYDDDDDEDDEDDYGENSTGNVGDKSVNNDNNDEHYDKEKVDIHSSDSDDDDDDAADDDDGDDDDDDDDDLGVEDVVIKGSCSSPRVVFADMNGAVDKNSNRTPEPSFTAVRKNNNVKLVDVVFEYVGLSQLDRETDI